MKEDVWEENELKTSNRKIHLIYIGFIIILIAALLITNFFNLTGLSHTRQLNRYKENLTHLKQPPNTSIFGAYSDLGHIYYGNGDNCDYITGIMLETDLSKEEIIDFYTGVTLPSVDGKGRVGLDITFSDKKSESGRLIYQVQTFEDALEAGFDIRCS